MDADVKVMTEVPPCPARPADAHKGTFGTVIVVGGCATMPGAPALAARAALRGGAGLVKIAAEQATLAMSLVIEPGATGMLLDDPDERDPAAVLAIGPGLGQSRDCVALVTRLVRRSAGAMVVDADGLNALARSDTPMSHCGPLVLTPHPGEYRRLAQAWGLPEYAPDDAARLVAAVALARHVTGVAVLKGHRTVVTDGETAHVNTTGNPALATAGSGDVLTGLIAALLAQGMTPLHAAVLGVYLHGRAADLWSADHGPSGLRAIDLADLLPRAFQQHRRP